jgi:hypothetical protein
LPPDVAPHDIERLVVGERPLEAAIGREDVVDIGDAHDARR